MTVDLIIECDICMNDVPSCCIEASETFSPDGTLECSLFMCFPEDEEDEGRWMNLCDSCKGKLNDVLRCKG